MSQFFDIFLLLGTGMFHSSVAMLPQSFTMYSLMLATEFWMVSLCVPLRLCAELTGPACCAAQDRRDFGCIFFVAVAGLIGWPFAAVPAVPIAADLLLRAPQKGSASKGGGAAAVIGQLARLVLYAVVSALVCLVPSVLVSVSASSPVELLTCPTCLSARSDRLSLLSQVADCCGQYRPLQQRHRRRRR